MDLTKSLSERLGVKRTNHSTSLTPPRPISCNIGEAVLVKDTPSPMYRRRSYPARISYTDDLSSIGHDSPKGTQSRPTNVNVDSSPGASSPYDINIRSHLTSTPLNSAVTVKKIAQSDAQCRSSHPRCNPGAATSSTTRSSGRVTDTSVPHPSATLLSHSARLFIDSPSPSHIVSPRDTDSSTDSGSRMSTNTSRRHSSHRSNHRSSQRGSSVVNDHARVSTTDRHTSFSKKRKHEESYRANRHKLYRGVQSSSVVHIEDDDAADDAVAQVERYTAAAEAADDAVAQVERYTADEEFARRLQAELDCEAASTIGSSHCANSSPTLLATHTSVNSSRSSRHSYSLPVERGSGRGSGRGYPAYLNVDSDDGSSDESADTTDSLSTFDESSDARSATRTFPNSASIGGYSPFHMVLTGVASFAQAFDTAIVDISNDYEMLHNLGERLGNVKEKKLNSAQLNLLPVRAYKKAPLAGTGGTPECHICMCEYRAREKIRTLLCFHEFHMKCIDVWLKRNATCPVCRVEVKV